LTPTAADGSAVDVLEVRVDAATASLFVNNQLAAAVALPTSVEDWTPGVQVGAAGDITVAAFRIEGDSLLGQPGRAPAIR
jgi:hypothetical protein